MQGLNLLLRGFFVLSIMLLAFTSNASTVTDLTATVSNGQVFITWTNPSGSNLTYKVYRSSTKITSSSQLTSTNYLGYVKDKSAKNVRKSDLLGKGYFFTIPTGTLTSSQGLYVSTCADNKNHYFAVTVVSSTGTEDQTIVLGSNSLNNSVQEHKNVPVPVLQATTTQSNGDINYEYVIWGNNQDVKKKSKAFNNCGSWSYNFTWVDRGSGTDPLWIKFDDDNPFVQMGSDVCSNCNILEVDDYLPNGNNTYWVGYNTNYDIYATSSPAQTTGVVRTYTQNYLDAVITWMRQQPSVDSTKVYTEGWSHNGFGSMFTGVMIPTKIAVAQQTSAPCLIKADKGSFREGQWCKSSYNLNSDITDPNTGDTIPIWTLLDIRKMQWIKNTQPLPLMTGVNGKNDVTVGWVQIMHWFDSVNYNRIGGIWYWDQRDHTGNGKNFTSDETDPDWTRYATNKSYPAMAYTGCNEDPGNGNPSDGDPYGSFNGYLDWHDGTINDQKCSYTFDAYITDFYVNGVKQPSHDSTTADITLRRLQKFKPTNGQTISWSVMNDAKSKIVQSGTLTYSSSSPITIYGAKVYESGSTVTFTINNCSKEESSDIVQSENSNSLVLTGTSEGFNGSIVLDASSSVEINAMDMLGRVINSEIVSMTAGQNTFSIPVNEPGAYIIQVKSDSFSIAKKAVYHHD